MLGINRLFVLRFEWLTLWPVLGLFPVTLQTLDILNILCAFVLYLKIEEKQEILTKQLF
jgi:hypothetical protein